MLYEQAAIGMKWMRLFSNVISGGIGTFYFDELQIPVCGFKENYLQFKESGDSHIDAWCKAVSIQIEKG